MRLFNPDHLAEIWAYRLPSLLGAIAAVLLTAATGSLLFGPATGLFAALMMASCLLLNVEARLAKTDAALLATIMLAQYSLAKAFLNRVQRHWLNAFLFWTALGTGILIKGPIILLVVGSTLLGLRMNKADFSWLRALKPIVGLIYLLLLVSPWFIAILMQSHGQFLEDSAGKDLLAKIWQGQDRGRLPPGLHFLVMPFIFFPFSLFVMLAIPDVWKNRKHNSFAFCLGWIIPVWIVFELSLTKLPHYVLPAYPAIAILAAKTFIDGYTYLLNLNSRWFLTFISTLWFFTGAAIAVAFAFLPDWVDHNGMMVPQILAGCALVIMQGVVLILLAQRKIQSVFVLIAFQLLFITCTFGLTLPAIQHLWVTRQAYDMAMAHNACPTLSMVSAAYDEPSLVFMAGTRTKLVTDGAMAAESMQQDHCKIGLIDAEHKSSFIAGFTAGNKQPNQIGEVSGYNIGRGNQTRLTLYSFGQ